MPELRKDPTIGRWVIISTERAKRPDQFGIPTQEPQEGECPFCEGKEHLTPHEVFALRKDRASVDKPGWEVRIVPSIAPFLGIEGNLDRRPRGLYDVMNGIGAHEVVIETPAHIANMADLQIEQISKVFYCYQERIVDLETDKRFKYVLIFKNYGWASGGGRIRHSRSQLIAMPANPRRVKEELAGSKHYYDYHERCIFCDMIRQEIDQNKRLILDVDGFVAISSFASRFPFETWILPKKHSPDFTSVDSNSIKDLAKILKEMLLRLKTGLNDPPYNYVIHTAPFRRKEAGYWQTIDYDYHWHMEIIPRLTRVAGFEWGTGFYICPLTPEDATKFLKEVKIDIL